MIPTVNNAPNDKGKGVARLPVTSAKPRPHAHWQKFLVEIMIYVTKRQREETEQEWMAFEAGNERTVRATKHRALSSGIQVQILSSVAPPEPRPRPQSRSSHPEPEPEPEPTTGPSNRPVRIYRPSLSEPLVSRIPSSQPEQTPTDYIDLTSSTPAPSLGSSSPRSHSRSRVTSLESRSSRSPSDYQPSESLGSCTPSSQPEQPPIEVIDLTLSTPAPSPSLGSHVNSPEPAPSPSPSPGSRVNSPESPEHPVDSAEPPQHPDPLPAQDATPHQELIPLSWILASPPPPYSVLLDQLAGAD